MPSEARQKKIMQKLNRAQKCSILGPQNLGSGGPGPPGVPLDPHLDPSSVTVVKVHSHRTFVLRSFSLLLPFSLGVTRPLETRTKRWELHIID